MKFLLLIQLFAVLFVCKQATAATDKVLCYYQTWSAVKPEDLDVNICTHIIYSFFGVNGTSGALRLDGNDDSLKRLAALKTKNKNLKLIISAGGWSEPPKGFSDIAKDAAKKEALAISAVSYLKKYNYDGLDIDWEYPSRRGGVPADKAGYVDMLRVLREHFDQSGAGYILTTAVSSEPDPSDYDVPGMSKYVHYINLMTYDFHSSSDGKLGQNSPLFASSKETKSEQQTMNCNASVTNWMKAGAPAEKLLLGLGFYGKSYKLADSTKHEVNDKSTGAGNAGSSYKQVCQLKLGWTDGWDDEQKNPYKYSASQWIGYDNPKSIGLKVQYAKQKGLGGVMMWAVDQDDNTGVCGTKWAMLNAIKENL